MVDCITFELPTNEYATYSACKGESESCWLQAFHRFELWGNDMVINLRSIWYKDGELTIGCNPLPQYNTKYQDVLLESIENIENESVVKVKLQAKNKNEIVNTAKACKFKVS